MTEAVQVAICVSVLALFTQLLVSWVQPRFNEKIERKAKYRLELRQCFSDFFGLLGAMPSGFAAHPGLRSLCENEDDSNSIDQQATSEWFIKYNALSWKIKSYLPNNQKNLLKAFCELEDNTADIYEMYGRNIICGKVEGAEQDKRTEEYIDKHGKREKLFKTLSDLATEYMNKL
jgi:hypothetical protein